MNADSKVDEGAAGRGGGDETEVSICIGRRQERDMQRWSWILLTALVVTVFGALLAALVRGPVEVLPRDEEDVVVVVNVAEDEGADTMEPPPDPDPPPPSVVLDLDVNAVSGASGEKWRDGSEGDAGPHPRTVVNVGGASASLSQAPPAVVGGGPDVAVFFPRDSESSDETRRSVCDGDGSTGETNPCATARLVARVRFEPGRRRVLSWHGERGAEIKDLGEIAHGLAGRTGALLAVGHADRCGRSKLAENRARKAKRRLRRVLKETRSTLRIYSQAAGEDPKAPEGNCAAEYYGTAGVYLIEGLT